MLHGLGQRTQHKSYCFFSSALSDSHGGMAGAGLSHLHCPGPEFKGVLFAMGMAPTGTKQSELRGALSLPTTVGIS